MAKRLHGFYWVIHPDKIEWQIAYWDGKSFRLHGNINQIPASFFIKIEKKRIIKELKKV